MQIEVGENSQLKPKVLIWRQCFSASKLLWREVKPEAEMLNQFIKLADASDDEVCQYARRWGTLNLCEQHWLPSTHNPFCEPLERPGSPKGEPISQWQVIASMMQAILNITNKLAEGELAESKDWKIFLDEEWFVEHRLLKAFKKDEKSYSEALKFQRRRIARIIDTWIEISALRPVMQWEDEKISLAFVGSPRSKLCGALVSQLLLMTGRSGLACCSECHVWYEREKRRPKKGQANYCKDCKDNGVPQRNAKRAQRVRKKDQKA